MSTARAFQVHNFTVELDQVSELSRALIDRLFESGCDDALVSCVEGRVCLDFDREAPSKEEAIGSAVRNIEAAGFRIANIRPNASLPGNADERSPDSDCL